MNCGGERKYRPVMLCMRVCGRYSLRWDEFGIAYDDHIVDSASRRPSSENKQDSAWLEDVEAVSIDFR